MQCGIIMTSSFPQLVHIGLLEGIQKCLDLFIKLSVLLAQIIDLIYRVQHGSVMLVAKFPADFGK